MSSIKTFGRKMAKALDARASRVPVQVGYPSSDWESVMNRCDGDATEVAANVDVNSYWRDSFIR